MVHELVSEVWRPGLWRQVLRSGAKIAHLDGDYRNNAAENLCVVGSERAAKRKSGVMRNKVAKHPNAKLNAIKRKRILAALAKGATQVELAEKYGVSQSLVSRVKRQGRDGKGRHEAN